VFLNLSQMKIYIIPGVTDMRKQIRGLSALLFDICDLNLQESNLFIFCGKTRKILKILYWDINGFCLWQKKLERDKFPWPRDQEEMEVIDLEKLQLLLKGIDFWKEHKPVSSIDFF
jgi:transposase